MFNIFDDIYITMSNKPDQFIELEQYGGDQNASHNNENIGQNDNENTDQMNSRIAGQNDNQQTNIQKSYIFHTDRLVNEAGAAASEMQYVSSDVTLSIFSKYAAISSPLEVDIVNEYSVTVMPRTTLVARPAEPITRGLVLPSAKYKFQSFVPVQAKLTQKIYSARELWVRFYLAGSDERRSGAWIIQLDFA